MKKYSGGFTKRKTAPGFTLIELLVVIAVLGVLATAIVAVINPLEKIAKAKDSTRKAQVSALANALQSYYTLKGGTYPAAGTTWIDALVANGDLKSLPPPVPIVTSSCTNQQNGYCYQLLPTPMIVRVYTPLATSERPSGTSGTTPYNLWDSATGESGTVYSPSGTIPNSWPLPIVFGPSSSTTQGLVGWWKMNETTGATTTIDSSGNGNNGTLTGGYTLTGTNYIFYGAGYVDMGGGRQFGTGDFSVSAWAKPAAAWTNSGSPVDYDVVSDGLGGAGIVGWQLFWDAYFGWDFVANAGGETAQAHQNSFPAPTTWTHLTGVRTATQIKLYVNGVEYAENQTTENTNNGLSNFIGAASAWGGDVRSRFPGSIDDVRVYNRALSASEVSNLFSAGPQ